MRIAFICTGNSARSQMAEAFAKVVANHLNMKLEVYSAGSQPAKEVNPFAVEVMAEKGIDISNHKPKGLEAIPYEEVDIVITLCDSARQTCPIFPAQRHIHWDLPDPAAFEGPIEAKREFFRKVRDDIEERVWDLLQGIKLKNSKG
ncbi:MAG: arsenate reductase ArsC [Aquificaceae bacterium]